MRKELKFQPSENVTINSAFEQFLKIKRNNGLSEHTLEYYFYSMKHFSQFFNGENFCSSITSRTIEDYIAFLREKERALSNISVNTYLRSIRTIIYFFMERDYTQEFRIKLIKQEKKIKETYTTAELEILLKKPDVKKCTFAEYRNWVISNYLLATGNRLSTVCHIKIGDIDFQNHEILLTKLKNKRQYIIPLSSRLEKVLLDYLIYRKGEKDEYLFCNRFGEQMNRSMMTNAIRKYNLARGVEKTSIHLYRHTFAKNWILNGGDIFRLKSILGHSSLDIVKEYAEMFGADLKRDFDNFNPLDNLGVRNRGASIQMTKRAK